MKHLLFMMLFPLLSWGQLQIKETPTKMPIGNAKRGFILIAELTRESFSNGDTTFFLTFKNQRFPNIEDYKTMTYMGNRTNADLYKVFKSVFTPENRKNKAYEVNFDLGGAACSVKVARSLGFTNAEFTTPAGYVVLSEAEVDNLFGKK